MLLGKVGTQHVKAREHPAASRALLVVNALLGCLHAEVVVDGSEVSKVFRQVIDLV